MAINYNGDFTIPAATSGYNPIAISSSTNATPIVVTTGSNHGYATGDSVAIEGHATNTNANGLHTVTVLTSNTFSLNGSVGNGVGGATGYAIDYAVNPLWQIPSDGDPQNASSVNVPIEAAANAVPWLYERVGAYRLYNIGRIAHSDAIDAGTVATASITNDSAWHSLKSWAYQWSFARDVNIYNTDILYVDIAMMVSVNTGASNGFALGSSFNGGAVTLATGSAVAFYSAPAALTPLRLSSTIYASDFTATQLNSMTINVMVLNANVGSETFTIGNPYHVNVYHYRVNS